MTTPYMRSAYTFIAKIQETQGDLTPEVRAQIVMGFYAIKDSKDYSDEGKRLLLKMFASYLVDSKADIDVGDCMKQGVLHAAAENIMSLRLGIKLNAEAILCTR